MVSVSSCSFRQFVCPSIKHSFCSLFIYLFIYLFVYIFIYISDCVAALTFLFPPHVYFYHFHFPSLGGGWTLVASISSSSNNHLLSSEVSCYLPTRCVEFINSAIPCRKLSDEDIHEIATNEGRETPLKH